MSDSPVANTEPPNHALNGAPPGSKPEKPPRPKKRKPNYAQLHSKPLPLSIYPLPAFHPSNPISLLKLAYTFLTQLLSPPSSHPIYPYTAYFSPETRSMHVTNPEHARALWEMGFFGKGTLSRSEPSWVEREKARLRDGAGGFTAAEDATRVRREERRLFKLERARAERERIERQRMVEEGRVELEDGVRDAHTNGEDVVNEAHAEADGILPEVQNGSIDVDLKGEGRVLNADLLQGPDSTAQLVQATPEKLQQPEPPTRPNDEALEPDLPISNQEHLNLTLEEAFFLTYSLGILNIYPSPPPSQPDSPPLSPKSTIHPYTPQDLFHIFCQHSFFPPSIDMQPDDPFLLTYVTYHHFRSLGWVIRPGLKFSVDFLLYNRGPVFSHAEFAVLVVPAYSHRYWNTPGGRSRRRVWEDGKDWWWLHAVNRVQSQVRKTLVLCYVEVPSPLDLELDEFDKEMDVGRVLRHYRVREFVVRRWVANRSRD